MKKRNLMSTAIICIALPAIAVANENLQQQSFSYIELGMESITYKEQSTSGAISQTSPAVANLIQRTGGYTPVTDKVGFYIETESTLEAGSANETWTVNPFGTVQTNVRTAKLASLKALSAYHLESMPGLHITTGLQYESMSFTRSNFAAINPGAANFDAAIKAAGNPNGFVTAGGAINEDSTSIMGLIGFRYNDFFANARPDSKFRLLVSGSVGVPLYYSIKNSQYPNTEWTSSFAGYDLNGSLGVSYVVFNNFSLQATVTANYIKRSQTSVVNGAYVPVITATRIAPACGFNWTF